MSVQGRESIRLGLLGCGVVGQGVLKILHDNRESIQERLGVPLSVQRIAVRDIHKTRNQVSGLPDAVLSLLTTDIGSVVNDPEVDIVIEVMGGIDTAASAIASALKLGKSVVTANKALLAEQGQELLQLGRAHNADLYFEAAVAGGVPIIRVLREALASDEIISIQGIVNGTSNYILSRMQKEGATFTHVLKAAQDAGYAEADPTFDVEGIDAAHKLVILSMLGFGVNVPLKKVSVRGISSLEPIDFAFARRFGNVIKLLAKATKQDGELEVRVEPTMVPNDHVLSGIHGALNAVRVEGKMLGPCLLSGLGAGSLPTATSVVSDVIDIGRNLLSGARSRSRPALSKTGATLTLRDADAFEARFYLRLMVDDVPGVLGKVATVLGQHNVSIEHMVQEGVAEPPVAMVMITHQAQWGHLKRAISQIENLSVLKQTPQILPIENA